jgi:hypothetical protein
MKKRRCVQCEQPLAKHMRSDTKCCSPACRKARYERRHRTDRALAHPHRCEMCRRPIVLVRKRRDTKFCSPACRQQAYRERKAAVKLPRKAHQRVIRERLAAADTSPPRNADINTAQVRAISMAEAAAIITQYEWLGTMPAVSRYCFGLFFDGELGGAEVYGDEYGENLGVWDRYGYSGKIIALLRGACTHWAHRHSASKLIRRSMRLLPKHYTVVTATVDAMAGEIGTIYQACGFDYVGVMRHQGGRALVRINGKPMSERQAGRLVGTQGAHALARLGFDAVSVPRRARYFGFRGDKRERARNRAGIAHLITAHPKRMLDAMAMEDRR